MYSYGICVSGLVEFLRPHRRRWRHDREESPLMFMFKYIHTGVVRDKCIDCIWIERQLYIPRVRSRLYPYSDAVNADAAARYITVKLKS